MLVKLGHLGVVFFELAGLNVGGVTITIYKPTIWEGLASRFPSFVALRDFVFSTRPTM